MAELNWIEFCDPVGVKELEKLMLEIATMYLVLGWEKTSQGVNGKWLSLLTRRESGIHMKENYNLTKMLWIVIRKNLKL